MEEQESGSSQHGDLTGLNSVRNPSYPTFASVPDPDADLSEQDSEGYYGQQPEGGDDDIESDPIEQDVGGDDEGNDNSFFAASSSLSSLAQRLSRMSRASGSGSTSSAPARAMDVDVTPMEVDDDEGQVQGSLSSSHSSAALSAGLNQSRSSHGTHSSASGVTGRASASSSAENSATTTTTAATAATSSTGAIITPATSAASRILNGSAGPVSGSSGSQSGSDSGANSGAGKLMSSKWNDQRASDAQKNDSVEASEDDLKATYYNAELGQLGCKHYRRGCKLKANCCGKWFNCRFCHDDVCDHNIVRNETKTMLCMKCKTIQPAAQDCNSCHTRLAAYYCDICKLWDDDPAKPIYHCGDCGICRIGRGLGQDYFHCKKCNVCMNISFKDDHKCIERNLECDCPICGEYMFTSTTTVMFMPCGHCIHSKCHEEYIKTSYQCPTCWKALGNMSGYYAKIDSLLAEQTMPPEYANIFSIVLCNDCEVKSEAPYHFLYHRCDKCKGYNTKVLETFKRVSNGQVQQVEVSQAVAEAAAAGNGSASGSGSGDSNSGGAESSGTRVSSGVGGSSLSSVPRSPLMDQNASGDMTMAGISGNSAP
ncbi:hypothetical protein BGZ94_004194 [Podila epigama]|nr:hypothetical protein BGZ94_004194 [Podila epigama]